MYAGPGIVTVDASSIEMLVREAASNPRRRIRLCAHSGVEDAVHEMVIVHEQSCYVRPHKHIGKSESFHVITGEVDVVLFDDDGKVTDVFPMGPFASGRPFFYRIAEPLFHTLLIRSPYLVFHETTMGPFRRDQTSYAPWAPDGQQLEEVATFLEGLELELANRL